MRRIVIAAETLPVARGIGIDRLEPGTASTEETIASGVGDGGAAPRRALGDRVHQERVSARASSRRAAPGVPIVVLTDQARTYRQLALVWGVMPFLVPHADTYEQMAAMAREHRARSQGIAKPGDRVVVTAGVPFDVPGTTNTLKVETV